ncbi:MAG: helix-turn-helix domain-containing protein [Pseudomonadota bacterium]
MEEIALLYGLHRNTVRQWIKRGLPTNDDQRPVLILGSQLAAYLTTKRTANKRPCKPGELYCVRCRIPQAAALGMADYVPLTPTGGNLVGLCPCCDALMHRRVSLAKLATVCGELQVTHTQARGHISESVKPSVNRDFKAGA